MSVAELMRTTLLRQAADGVSFRLDASLRAEPPANGFLDVLNCGAGHLTFRFDKKKGDDSEKAKKVIADMLRRGYMIFILIDGQQTRVRKFDPEHEEYILEEPDVIPEPEPLPEMKLTGKARRVGMRQAKATAIGATAGG